MPSLLLGSIPDRGGALKWDRRWITVLTAQVATGAALGTAAQLFLVGVIIGHVMPLFGLELLDMARGVAAFNLPASGWAVLRGQPVGPSARTRDPQRTFH